MEIEWSRTLDTGTGYEVCGGQWLVYWISVNESDSFTVESALCFAIYIIFYVDGPSLIYSEYIMYKYLIKKTKTPAESPVEDPVEDEVVEVNNDEDVREQRTAQTIVLAIPIHPVSDSPSDTDSSSDSYCDTDSPSVSDTHSDSHTHREVYVESGDSHVNS